MKRDWKTLIECAKVNNRQPEQLEHFEALRDLLRLQAARENLVWRWQRQMAVLGGPDATTLGSAPENALHQYIDPMRRCLDWFLQSWAPLENELRRQGFQWDRFLAEMPVNHAEYGDIRRLCNAVVEHLPAL